MGCGGSKDTKEMSKADLVELKGIDAPLNSRMNKLDVASLDETFKKATELIDQLEVLRTNIVDDRDNVVLKTGLCTRSNVGAVDYFVGVVIKLAVDAKTGVENVNLKFEQNQFKLGSGSYTDQGKDAANTFAAWANKILTLEDSMKKVHEDLTKFGENFTTEMNEKHLQELRKAHPDKKDKEEHLKTNLTRVRLALEAAPLVSKQLQEDLGGLRNIPNMLGNKDMIAHANSVKDKAIEGKATDPLIIVFNYADVPSKPKFGNTPEEGRLLWTKKQFSRRFMKESYRK